MTVDILNQLINQYTGSVVNIQTGSIALGKELFNAVALLSVGILGINHLLRKNVDMVEANLELIRWLIYLDCFYAFITNYSSIYAFVFLSIQQIGNYLGAQAAGAPVNISPENIIHIGWNISKNMFLSNLKFNLFKNFFMVLFSFAAGLVILYCFAVIGLELILVQIGSQIIFAGGIFLLAFSGLQWTRDYAERYVHTFFHMGIKIIFIYILVGIGAGLAQTWSQVLTNASLGQIIDYDISVCLSAFVYYKLCLKIPEQAVSFLTGRFPMNFDSAASVNAAVRGAVREVHRTDDKDGAAKNEGMGQAVSAASQLAKTTLAAQGKKENLFNTGWETIKTLGEARMEVKQEEWDRKVNDTEGGKMAKNILDKMPKPLPDPQPAPAPNNKSDSNLDQTDYSI